MNPLSFIAKDMSGEDKGLTLSLASIFLHIALDFKQDISFLGLILCDRGIEASTCGIDTPVTIKMDSIPSLSGTGALGYKYDKNDTKH